MPDAPPKPCHYPGCRALASAGHARCAAHMQAYDWTTRKQSAALTRAARLRSSIEWRRLRTHFVSEHPLCCDPFGEHKHGPEPTKDVHHVLPLVTHPHLGLVVENLRPLCRACHNRVEAMERRGEATQALFSHASAT